MANHAGLFERVRDQLKARLSRTEQAVWRRRLAGPLGWLYRNDLRTLSQIFGSDKWGWHFYAQHYEWHFAHLRRKPIVLLEIGIGGYDDPASGGGSLRMWRRYFPRARIYGLDVADKRAHDGARIRTFRGDQSDEKFLRQVVAQTGPPHIVIDDGSHQNRHVIQTFNILFPLMADQGIYAAEDLQTAYWPAYGGSSEDLEHAPTSVAMFKRLTDGLNHEEFIRPGYVPSYFDEHIVSIHFYHCLVLVRKGRNMEGSTAIKNDLPPD